MQHPSNSQRNPDLIQVGSFTLTITSWPETIIKLIFLEPFQSSLDIRVSARKPDSGKCIQS